MSTASFVVFDGIDGCGKTTLINGVRAALADQGIPCRRLVFPGRESAVGALIRDVFDGQEHVELRTMLWLFAGEAVDMDAVIREELDRGAVVLCDRFTPVTALVYQTEQHERAEIEAVLAPGKLMTPDRVYVVDVPAETALARRAARGEARNRLYEPADAARLDQQRYKYRSLAVELPQAVLLDGAEPPERLVAEVLADMGWTP